MRVRALTAAPVIIGAAVLAGCTTEGTPVADPGQIHVSASTTDSSSPTSDSPIPTDSSSPTSTSADPGSSDAKLFLTVARRTPAFSGVSDERLLAAGEQACSDLRSGKSVAETASNVDISGASLTDGAMLVGMSVGALCPDQKSKVTG